jgi:undecaprenyl-diphosphatase
MAALIVATKWPQFTTVAWTVAVISCFLIALSRVYLGAHYASDVVGGWIVGGIGLVAIILLVY